MLLGSPLCDFGWQAPNFSLKDPDGHSHTMTDYLGERGLLIAFICNHCPYVQTIADRLATDTALLMAEGINVLAVMSNDYEYVPMDAPENMKIFAAQYKFTFPYLIDKDQSVGRVYKAICTPDFFGLNRKGQLQYRGRLDDVPHMQDVSNRTPELVNAMREIAETTHGPRAQNPSMGCSIKWH